MRSLCSSVPVKISKINNFFKVKGLTTALNLQYIAAIIERERERDRRTLGWTKACVIIPHYLTFPINRVYLYNVSIQVFSI